MFSILGLYCKAERTNLLQKKVDSVGGGLGERGLADAGG